MLSGTSSLARRMRLQNYSIEATCPMFRWDFICVLLFCFFAISTQPPFYMWTEVPGGGGAVNFITGMGGFLQAKLLYGISCSELPQPGSYSWISWREGPTRPFRGITSSLKSSALTDRSPGVAKIASCYLAPHFDWVATARGKDGLDRHHRVLVDRG